MKGKFINKPLFKLQRKSTMNLIIIFSVVISALMLLALGVYPMMEEMLAYMPEELKGLVNMSSIAEYFNVEAFEMWIMVVSIFGCVVAINLTTKEFKNGSYELIYTLNISRGEVIRTKLLRLVLNVIYVNVAVFVASLAGLLIFGSGQFSVVNLLVYALLAIVVTLQVSILAFSLGLINKGRFNTFGGVVIVIIMFLLTTLSIGADSIKWLGYLSPLTTMYGSIMASGFKGIPTNGILLAVWSVLSIILLILSAKKFKNDDLC